ncbi:MAG: LON peptidase substrate-binding domain-containing protein [Vicinamibacterales bacterium]
MLPPEIPIFPLPNVVLFPHVFLPLHIFESRYRAMVEDALAGDRIIGMVLLRPGWEGSYEHRPPVYPVGCAGLITHADRLTDGRFNIVLRGLEKFRILGESHEQTYRLARVDTIAEMLTAGDRPLVTAERRRLESMVAPGGDSPRPERVLPKGMPDEDLVNAHAQYLELEPVEKQALLERDGLVERCRSLIELLEMKRLLASKKWTEGVH